MKRRHALALLPRLPAVLVAASCTDSTAPGRTWDEHAELTIAPRIIEVGGASQAVGNPRRADGTAISASRVRVTYASGDPAISTVGRETGRIVGIAPGRVLIFAEFEGRRAADTLTVIPRQ